MDIQDLRIFARVAAVQSLSAVGNEFGLTAGTISKRLQALEAELNARLFDRTTRSVRITPEGQVFLDHVERVLDNIEKARSAIEDSSGRAAGKLRIAAPTHLGRRVVAPAISAFLGVYPEIEVEVDLVDRPVNLQEQGYDLVINYGALSDSTLIVKRLAPESRVLVAAPGYLKRNGAPRSARDLEQHQCLALAGERHWPIVRSGGSDGEPVQVRPRGRLCSNSYELLHVAAIEGHGILATALSSVEDDLAAGRLVRILPEHELGGDAVIHALYSGARHQPPRLRALLDFLSEWIRRETQSARAQARQEAPHVATAPAELLRLDASAPVRSGHRSAAR